EPESRRQVVLVDRVVAGALEQRVAALIDRRYLEVVSHPKAEGSARTDPPLVLAERFDGVRVHVEVVGTADAERETFRIRPWVRRIERQIRIEEKAAVHVGLHGSPENRVVV